MANSQTCPAFTSRIEANNSGQNFKGTLTTLSKPEESHTHSMDQSAYQQTNIPPYNFISPPVSPKSFAHKTMENSFPMAPSRNASIPNPGFPGQFETESRRRADSLPQRTDKYIPPAANERHPHGFYATVMTDEPAPLPTPRDSFSSTRPRDLHQVRAAYCARCMFWISEGWIAAEAGCQGISFVDQNTIGLDHNGRDIDGHRRIDNRICPICIRERMIISEARGENERKAKLKALDDLLALWAQGKLIMGMTKDVMRAKKVIITGEEDDVDELTRDIAKVGVEKDLKKVKKKGPSEGAWQAITLGLLMTSEILARI